MFSSGRKSPKDKAAKEKPDKKLAIAIAAAEPSKIDKDAKQQEKQPSSPSHTRPYEYTDEDNTSPTRRTYTPGGFRYDSDPSKGKRESDSGQLSPASEKKKKEGLAFNYAPGDDLKGQAEKIKLGEFSPKATDKKAKPLEISPPTKSAKSYSPSAAEKTAELPGFYKPRDDSSPTKGVDPNASFLAKERDGSDVPLVPLAPIVATPEVRKKRVKILVIISKFDPKTKRIDSSSPSAIVEHSTGILNTETGKIETKYGVVDPKKGTVEILNTRTGNTDTYQGTVDTKTNNIHLTSGVSNKTGNIDSSLGQIICVAPQDKPVLDITSIVGKLDAGKVDIANGSIERSRGLLDLQNDVIETKYGNIDLKNGEIKAVDPKSGKVTSKQQAKYDNSTGLFTISGAVDQKTGKFDSSLGQIIALGSQIDPVVEGTYF